MNNSFCIQILKISVCLASADEHYWLTCDVSHGNCSSNLQTFTEQAYSLTKHWHRTCLTTLTTAHSKYSILALWHLQQVVKVIGKSPHYFCTQIIQTYSPGGANMHPFTVVQSFMGPQESVSKQHLSRFSWFARLTCVPDMQTHRPAT